MYTLAGGLFLPAHLKHMRWSNGIISPNFQGKHEKLFASWWFQHVSAHLKHISQNGSFPQIGVNMKQYLKPPPSLEPWLMALQVCTR